jgi:hypothetical protein
MEFSTILKLQESYSRKEYIDNAILAEEIYNTVEVVRSLGSTKNGIDKWLEEIYKELNIISNTDKYIIQCFMTIKLNTLRLEFDEEYAEMQFV